MSVKAVLMMIAVYASAMLHLNAFAASAEVSQADAQRKKPLQRCDQMKDAAELECLRKARERIVDARQKREASVQAKASSNTATPKSAGKDAAASK